MSRAPAHISLVEDEPPFGEIPLAPYEMTGLSEAQLARALAEHHLVGNRRSEADVMHLLRRLFPHSPLTVRVAGLAALMRR